MLSISSFFGKFKNIAPPERFVKEECVKAVARAAGITIVPEDVSVRGDTVFIAAPPAKKTTLMLEKHAVLSELQNALKPYRKTISRLQ